jgi:hypothetical protein
MSKINDFLKKINKILSNGIISIFLFFLFSGLCLILSMSTIISVLMVETFLSLQSQLK